MMRRVMRLMMGLVGLVVRFVVVFMLVARIRHMGNISFVSFNCVFDCLDAAIGKEDMVFS